MVIKIEQDGKEIRLLGNYPTASSVHHYIRKAIDAKMCIKRWAKSSAIGANVSVESYASIAAERIGYLKKIYTCIMNQYNRDRDGNCYITRRMQ